jgi:hypothetical protein
MVEKGSPRERGRSRARRDVTSRYKEEKEEKEEEETKEETRGLQPSHGSIHTWKLHFSALETCCFFWDYRFLNLVCHLISPTTRRQV